MTPAVCAGPGGSGRSRRIRCMSAARPEGSPRWQEYSRRKELLVVEGVGGLLVPLRRDLLLADFLGRIRLPTLLVARSGLGTLNHTLLSLEALRSRDIPVLGVVFSDIDHCLTRPSTDNQRALRL